MLCQLLSGDALTIIKGAPDCQGYTAWQRLYRKYSPRTLARGVKLLGEVVNPPRVKELNDVEAAICRWEEKLRKLKQIYNEDISGDLKIAVFTNCMPVVVQDFVYTNLTQTTTYEEIKDKVRALISNKLVNADTKGRAPMDIGNVKTTGWDFRGQQQHEHQDRERCEEGEEAEVDGINAQCFKCGGWGHIAKECPTRGKGKGKGKGKDANGAKGGGKAFSGNCHRCGKPGHRAAQCTATNPTNGSSNAKPINNVQGAYGHDSADSGVEEVAECGGVWMIGGVSVIHGGDSKGKESGGPVMVKGAPGGKGASSRNLVWNLRNRFAGLTEYEGENDEAGRHGLQDKIITNSSDGLAEIGHVGTEGKKMTRESAIRFNVTDSRRPLVSAVKICEAGNRVYLDKTGGYIENEVTKERMRLRKSRGTFVFDVQYAVNGEEDEITLDSGAGISVWPRDKLPEVKLEAKQAGLRMIAANGTNMNNYGQKLVRFHGIACEDAGFRGRA